MVLLLQKLLIWLAFIYVCLFLFLVFFQRSFIYFPSTNMPNFRDYGLSAKNYEIVETKTSDNLELNGWYHRDGKPDKPLIIWFHGNAGSHADRAVLGNMYVKAGYPILLAGYRGYGGNPGKPTERGFFLDAEAWYKFALEELGKTPDQIVLYGESLGSGVAVELATRFDAKALILHTPYTSLRALAEKQYPIYPIRLVMKDQYDSLSRIARIKMPVFIFHGAKDEIIPSSHPHILFEAAPEPKALKILPEARHGDVYYHDAFKLVHSFLKLLDQK